MAEALLSQNMVLHGTNNEQYTILNLVGRGGMGAVYRVRRKSDQSYWALKEMRPHTTISSDEYEDNRKLFEQEARLLKSLSHPNIPAVVDFFRHDNRPVMVMEYIDGKTLEDLLHDGKMKLDEHQIVSFGIQLCRVLHYLHTQTPPIIYRDLKPPNVMVASSGVLKLIDFGVARTRKQNQAKDTIAMGSAGYAPPEQYGKEQTDARSDIYALGATLYHLATGMPPVPLQQVQIGNIRKHKPDMKAKTERVIVKAMWLKREGRYATCAEMEQALLVCLDKPYLDPTSQDSAAEIAGESDKPLAPPPSSQPLVPVAALPVVPDDEASRCTSCGRTNKTGAKFCAGCGMPIGVPPVAKLLIRSSHGTWEMNIDRLPFRIGRRDPRRHHYPELDLAEHDRGVASRNHATIQLANDVYMITDLGSTNGTMVNEQRITPNVPHKLRTGDRIKVGEVIMEFTWS
jgi:serine/threonine protein kinase